jgi:hypothetical protein
MDEFCKSLTERGHEVCIVCRPIRPSGWKGSRTLFHDPRALGERLVSEDDRLAIP